MDKRGLIGNRNSLPWHIPADLKYFKEVTEGNTVIMGRKTFESIGQPLPDRKNIVLTTNESFNADNAEVHYSFDELLAKIKSEEDEEFIVIGGAEIYKQFLPFVDTLYITHIDHDFEGDIHFPVYNKEDFVLSSYSTLGISKETNYNLKFAIYDRVKNKI
jgi:dihydrofolate reductase